MIPYVEQWIATQQMLASDRVALKLPMAGQGRSQSEERGKKM
jgi:hypothetical protein